MYENDSTLQQFHLPILCLTSKIQQIFSSTEPLKKNVKKHRTRNGISVFLFPEPLYTRFCCSFADKNSGKERDFFSFTSEWKERMKSS